MSCIVCGERKCMFQHLKKCITNVYCFPIQVNLRKSSKIVLFLVLTFLFGVSNW